VLLRFCQSDRVHEGIISQVRVEANTRIGRSVGSPLQASRDAPQSHPAFPPQTQGDSYRRFLRACHGSRLLTGFGLPGWFGTK
jgi:hypothetical protein